MRISVVGTGYVGLVTGVSLSEIGHHVTCIDIDEAKVEKMKQGHSPIYEPGLAELMTKNIEAGQLFFTIDHATGFHQADVIYIAVGTPEKEDGSANLAFVKQVATQIASHVSKDTVVVTKSTVPVGTNDKVKEVINQNLVNNVHVDVVSNPEFLKEGSAIHDSFNGDRIVIGSDSEHAASLIEEVNQPFGVPIYRTDVRSAEMIKYASNAFLATKISFINEIANICDRVNANVEDVAKGMGMDRRIGDKFLNAGIGYGGSCFPKDTKALIQIAGNAGYDFELLKGVVKVNQKQQALLLDKLYERFTSLDGKRIAVLGLAFKPNTDDMREAASIVLTEKLIEQGAEVVGYDPIAMDNARNWLSEDMFYAESVEDAVEGSDATLIVTEWDEIKHVDLDVFKTMKYPLVVDGRNCFGLDEMKEVGVEYHSVGRPGASIEDNVLLQG
ncbi:UDP-glucose/GDP-mannose dehydrogenase family protein [Virgibacillus sp. NKC19-16]|uniref:UDP-glucose dehydrogenase family protein n=1 Tax=Virgibacillus salidurans TaxID=2831673 RepID=UPI001F349937|nr:UDP-glucose/GDP-mannose dehydrogenase family protein [Virgibacillus sp. NKC19-16]UJL45820.1 UDP-glucose/GDP-mannose dehydrogenase family protein [Virgibacillus sp. NKC19-16]